MQTDADLQAALRRFKDVTGARACSVWSPDFKSRVAVGHPASGADVAAGTIAPIDLQPIDAAALSRCLFANVADHAVIAEFESEDAAREAQVVFDRLVGEVGGVIAGGLA